MKKILSKASLLLMSMFVFQMIPALAQQTNQTNQPNQTPAQTQAAASQQARHFYDTCKRLGLSMEQEKKMQAIMQESRTEVKALKEANKDKPEAEKQRLLMEQLKKTDDKVMAILTKEQQVAWRQIVEERKVQMLKKREEHMKHKGASEMDDTQGLL